MALKYKYHILATLILNANFSNTLLWPKLIENIPVEGLKSLLLNTLASTLSTKDFPKLKKIDLSDSDVEAYQTGCDNEDKDLNITELITKNGFKVETHEVQTSDGYILTMFRIPGDGPPVFLMHGLLSSADDWTTNGRNNSLSYLLADRGYDVWLGNARGNKHSRKHATLCPVEDKYQFWNFSWDEIGRYDLPAMIDHILDTTGNQRLTYIGHSQGCTSFYVLCSEIPEYNQKISFAVALTSPVFMAATRSPLLQALAPLADNEQSPLVKALGPELLACDVQEFFKALLCDDASDIVSQLICSAPVFLLTGFDYKQAHYERLATIFSHLATGSAAHQAVHYAQSIVSGQFKQFDHGVFQNTKVYGSATPPHYPLEKVTVPIAIFRGKADLVDPKSGVKMLLNRLTNANCTFHEVPSKSFAHLEFLFARDAKKLVYDKVLNLIEENS